MIKFFRKIRQRLLAENKFSKYLMYAFGEVILVVIGILIALQVNNQNEIRKLKVKELDLLQNFEKRLQTDLFVGKWFAEVNNQVTHSIDFLINHMEEDLPYADSLKYHFGNITSTYGVTADFAAFKELKSIGTDIITNEHLKTSLIDYYSQIERFAIGATKDYEKVIADASKTLFPEHFDQMWKTEEFKIGKIPVGEMIPNDYEQLKNDKAFMYFLKTLKNQHYVLIEIRAPGVLERNEKLLSEINKEIVNLKK